MIEGTDFLGVVLQLAHGCTDLGLEIRFVGDRHSANRVGFEVFPDQFIGIVEAPDEEAAIQAAIREFRIEDSDEQKRLVATRRD